MEIIIHKSFLLKLLQLTLKGMVTGCRPEGASAMTWKWEVEGGPIGEGRPSRST